MGVLAAELREARLAYELRGGDGPLVALLNGVAMSMSHWEPLAAALVAGGFRVLLHDFRGQLLSEKPREAYSLAGHAADLAALLDRLGEPEAALVGTSYGAEVALAFARDFPGRCASLVLVDGVASADAVLRAAVESWRRAALADPRLFYRVILPWNYSAAYLEREAAALSRREDAIAALPREWFEAFDRLCAAFLKIDLAKDLRRITCPALVVVGGADILKHRGYAREIAEGLRVARLVELEGAGHALAVERPAELAALVLDFLGEPGSRKEKA